RGPARRSESWSLAPQERLPCVQPAEGLPQSRRKATRCYPEGARPGCVWLLSKAEKKHPGWLRQPGYSHGGDGLDGLTLELHSAGNEEPRQAKARATGGEIENIRSRHLVPVLGLPAAPGEPTAVAVL